MNNFAYSKHESSLFPITAASKNNGHEAKGQEMHLGTIVTNEYNPSSFYQTDNKEKINIEFTNFDEDDLKFLCNDDGEAKLVYNEASHVNSYEVESLTVLDKTCKQNFSENSDTDENTQNNDLFFNALEDIRISDFNDLPQQKEFDKDSYTTTLNDSNFEKIVSDNTIDYGRNITTTNDYMTMQTETVINDGLGSGYGAFYVDHNLKEFEIDENGVLQPVAEQLINTNQENLNENITLALGGESEINGISNSFTICDNIITNDFQWNSFYDNYGNYLSESESTLNQTSFLPKSNSKLKKHMLNQNTQQTNNCE